MLSDVYIPYGCYYTSPFCRWNGVLKEFNSIKLSSDTTKFWFYKKNIPIDDIDFVYYGSTVYQKHQFWSHAWCPSMIGLRNVIGLSISQACTTGLYAILLASTNIESKIYKKVYTLTSDRTSNGPHVTWNDNQEIPVLENFKYNPLTKNSMLDCAENVAKKFNIDKNEIDDVVLMRYSQYNENFHEKIIFETNHIKMDVGVKNNITEDRLKKLPTIQKNGTHSILAQTHPSDGHSGIMITNYDIAKDYCDNIFVKIVSFGWSTVDDDMMPYATVPASKIAIEKAGISLNDIKVVKQHNAFAVNDVILAKELNISQKILNNNGSPLVYGHPQSPVLSRLLIEAIEEIVELGGGFALITGAAGGDIGISVIIKVDTK